MKETALATAVSLPRFIPLDAPFSNFDFVDEHFDQETAIRRLFSQARTHEARTLVVEAIKPEGAILSENREIRRIHADYRMSGLQRLSFWSRPIRSTNELPHLRETAKWAGRAVTQHP